MARFGNSSSLPRHTRAKEAGWLEKRISYISSVGGYQKPDLLPDALKLDSNENYVIPKQFQSDVMYVARKNADVRAYPLGGTERLVSAISKTMRIPAPMIAVGNGSDQILDMILVHLALCADGGTSRSNGTVGPRRGSKPKKILTSDPTFGFFEDRCRLYGIPLVRVPFSKGMKMDMAEFSRRASDADMIYLDSPNNPTGFQFPRHEIQKIISDFEGPVIIDEAYGEFAGYSASAMTRRHKNLIIVRTMSKSFGLAGLRLGYMIADKTIAQAFSCVIQYPYPLSTITIESGIEALSRVQHVRSAIDMIKSERARMISALQEYDAFEVFDSDANFVLFDAKSAYKRVHSALAEQGISVRRLGAVGSSHQGCLRVSVGTREMNSRFLLAIRDLLR